MEDRELKHLSRSELLDIIYTLRKNQDTLERMNADLKAQLEDRRIDIENSGSIAEASLAVTKIFDEAQKAADIYLSEIRRRAEELGSDDADAVDVSEPCGGGALNA